MNNYTITDYLEAIRRELAKRETTYPKIIQKKIKQGMSEEEVQAEINAQSLQNDVLKITGTILSFEIDGLGVLGENVERTISHITDTCLMELKREMKMRKKYYPRLIYFKRITPETAERETAVWAALVDYFNEKYIGTCLPS